MSTTFPTTLQDLDATRGTDNQTLSTPNHVTHHHTEDDTIEALQAKVGVDSSAVTTSHDYKLSEVTSTAKAVSTTGTQTITGAKTFTTGGLNVNDNILEIRDDLDTTKKFRFQVSGVTTATTRTLTVPDADTTIVGTDTTQTLTGKTLGATTLSGAITAGDNNITGLKTGTFTAEYDNGNSGTSKTVDWGVGQKQKITTTGSCTLTFTAPAGTGNFTLRIIHEASATSYTYTWPGTVKWTGGVAPVTTNTSGAVDIVTFYYNGTNYYGVGSLAFA